MPTTFLNCGFQITGWYTGSCLKTRDFGCRGGSSSLSSISSWMNLSKCLSELGQTCQVLLAPRVVSPDSGLLSLHDRKTQCSYSWDQVSPFVYEKDRKSLCSSWYNLYEHMVWTPAPVWAKILSLCLCGTGTRTYQRLFVKDWWCVVVTWSMPWCPTVCQFVSFFVVNFLDYPCSLL